MNMEALNDKYSIKNLLFTKAIPNYVIPFDTSSHKLYSCSDCGDRFIFETSYIQHINRKSVRITYMCRHCSQMKEFKNRCNLLSHIRSHNFKTATINVSDLRVEPLPLSLLKVNKKGNLVSVALNQAQKKTMSVCFECKKDITFTGTVYKDRAKHYMQYTNRVYSCPICLFTLPTSCGLEAHLRLHLKTAPHYCPECGIQLTNKSVAYPFSHDCEGFKMMRATSRYACPITDSHIIHPNEYISHFKKCHFKPVYKCPVCAVACFNEATMLKHVKIHKKNIITQYFQCDMCIGRLFIFNQIEKHVKFHVNNNKTIFVYPCWTCGVTFKDIRMLLNHQLSKHGESHLKKIFSSLLQNNIVDSDKNKPAYRVVKRCDKCFRSFTYRCQYENIRDLPNECPYKCSSITLKKQIICPLCKVRIPENWTDIKNHFGTIHKNHKCLDIKLKLKKYIISKSHKKKSRLAVVQKQQEKSKDKVRNKKRTSLDLENLKFDCKKCELKYETKELLELHMVTHRDPCMAYQCMECGQCFVVKPSFSKHLLLEHNIHNVQDYIEKKKCFNINALDKFQSGSRAEEDLPIEENQCTICREKFESSEALEKHFRVHGMAFLKKNTQKSP